MKTEDIIRMTEQAGLIEPRGVVYVYDQLEKFASMIQKQTSKKQEYETAKSHFEHCSKVLRANEILWNDIWEAQPNPFLKIKEYTSPEQTAMRKPIIDAWVDAKKKYLELAKKQPRI